jgi:hypothetical protein
VRETDKIVRPAPEGEIIAISFGAEIDPGAGALNWLATDKLLGV